MKPTEALWRVFADRGPQTRLATGPTAARPRPYIYTPRTGLVFDAEQAMRDVTVEGNVVGPEIQAYVDEVLARPWPRWRAGPMWPATVRINQQAVTAGYRSGIITVPSPIRKLIVLHEIAHHFDPPRPGNPVAEQHGVAFVRAFLDLIETMIGTVTADVFREQLDAVGVQR